MTKQFNFYDFYGYLLPGMLLLGLFWLPVGVLTQTWPDQDLSKALFLAALAYIVGHLLQTVAISVVPSTAVDSAKRQRMPSDLLLDTNNSKFSEDVKERLSKQVKELFGLDLGVTQDWDGKNDISKNRQTAFFQARSYLIAKKAAQYAEQYQGLYAMMRGLGVSFLAGAMYLAGWGLSFHRNSFCLFGRNANPVVDSNCSSVDFCVGCVLSRVGEEECRSFSSGFFNRSSRGIRFLGWELAIPILCKFRPIQRRTPTLGQLAPCPGCGNKMLLRLQGLCAYVCGNGLA